jgi:hypothetical protein
MPDDDRLADRYRFTDTATVTNAFPAADGDPFAREDRDSCGNARLYAIESFSAIGIPCSFRSAASFARGVREFRELRVHSAFWIFAHFDCVGADLVHGRTD